MIAAIACPEPNPDIRLTEPHDHHAIGAMLRRRGTNPTRVAREAGLYESACRLAMIARGYPEAEAAIARAIGYPVEVLWPERYPASALKASNLKAEPQSRQKRALSVDAGKSGA